MGLALRLELRLVKESVAKSMEERLEETVTLHGLWGFPALGVSITREQQPVFGLGTSCKGSERRFFRSLLFRLS